MKKECLTRVIVFSLLSWFLPYSVSAQTVKIGLISSVTGPMAAVFKSEIEAAKPAAELINKKGGVKVGGKNYMIEIVTGDDQSSPPGAVSAVNKLLQQGVMLFVAPMFIPSNMAISSICEEAKALRVTPNCADLSLFAAPNRLNFNGEASYLNVPHVYMKLKALYPGTKRIAIIRPDDPGAKAITERTIEEIRRQGMEVVFHEAYKIPTEDFYPLLTKALQTKPDAIEGIFAIIPWMRGIINQAREMGFKGPIWLVSACGDTNLLKAAIEPKYAHDIMQAAPDLTSEKMLPIVKEFKRLVETETKTALNYDHIQTLRALLIIVQGIEKAQSLDPERIAKALEEMESIDMPYGKGRFTGKDLIGQNRLMRDPIPFSRFVKEGRIEFEFLPLK